MVIVKQAWFIILILSLLVACAPIATATVVTREPTATIAVTLTPESAPTETLTPTLIPTRVTDLNFYYPRIEKYCPSQKEVALEKVGFGQDTQLILTDLNQSGIWGISFGNLAPVLIAKIVPDGWISSYSISPDGNWLAYSTVTANSASISIFSFESKSIKKNISLDYWDGLVPKVSWLSDNEVLIENNCGASGCHFPLYVFNLRTDDLQDVDKDDVEPYGDYLEFFKDSGDFYALYQRWSGDNYNSFDVYDYAKNVKIHTFPWLDNKVLFYPIF